MENRITGHSWNALNYKVSPRILESYALSGTIKPYKHPISCPFWTLDYTFTGSGKCKAGNSRVWEERNARTAHLYPPNTVYWEHVEQESVRNSAWFIFSGGEDAGLDKLIDPAYGFVEFLDPTGTIGGLLNRAATLNFTDEVGAFFKTQVALFQLIELLLKSVPSGTCHYIVQPGGVPQGRSKMAGEVMSYFSSKMNERVTLKDVAGKLGISESALSHAFKLETGETPIHALIKLRVSHSKTLLLQKYPLKAIAETLGFYDEYSFSKTFKKLEGVSPREFIRAKREETA
jgi:AraC-like DNA-binding protein